jgi:hypothetical protein
LNVPDTAVLDTYDLNVEQDSTDFRDRIYRPTLEALPLRLLPDATRIVLLDQGEEGACTGFGLAAMINYLNKGRGVDDPVSARMLYEMAKRHDQWPGTAEEGSSARGAMKGWHKNGVCSESTWRNTSSKSSYFTRKRQLDALKYPLGAYYRVLKKRSDLHAALHETGAVFATAGVHKGWDQVTQKGEIPDRSRNKEEAGHAFCILGYTEDGFLIQNSWGDTWGGITIDGVHYPGMALWRYPDFDLNLWDAWVARMALPVESLEALAPGKIRHTAQGVERAERGPPRHEIAQHYIHIDDGEFYTRGNYPSSKSETRQLLQEAVDSMAAYEDHPPGHILLYAHGGLNSAKSAAARVASWRPVFKKNRVWDIHFIWETGLMESLKDVILGKEDLVTRRAGGGGEWVDRIIERTTQGVGFALWKEMTEDAHFAFRRRANAGFVFLRCLQEVLRDYDPAERPKLHLMAHSAGSIWMGHLIQRWASLGGAPFDSLQLFAPACTIEFYKDYIESQITSSQLKTLTHYLLDEATERNDTVASIYRKSLLYLVSRAYQNKNHVVPLMGLEEHWNQVVPPDAVTSFVTNRSPNQTQSDSHGGFDNDLATMNNALRVVLGRRPTRLFKEEDLAGY